MNKLKAAIFTLKPKKTIIDICKRIGLLNNCVLQIDLVNNILNSEILRRFPLPKAYQRDITYEIIKHIEGTGGEVCDELYLYLSQITNAVDSNTRSHIIITLPNSLFVKESHDSSFAISKEFAFSFEECNLVGMRPWYACYRLVEWLVYSASLDRNIVGSDIIELGSGIGISSIIPFLLLPVSSICSTDYDPEIIRNLQYNFEINEISLNLGVAADNNSKEKFARIMCLDWETIDMSISDEIINPLRNPIIISSDVIYDDDLTLSFVRTLKCLLVSSYVKKFGCYPKRLTSKLPKDKSIHWNELLEADFNTNKVYAVSVNTVRNENTIQYFVDCCIYHGLTVSLDSTVIPSIFDTEFDNSTLVFIISC
ncbi:hypothetical protein OJ253_2271 [Cryptosporidium canis]|uniref:Uncharacterized protein n=1 Tax=Cryptosporidium canis TaxID=195482 RepID=A0A9D5DFG7_9CRYT|nr:hypothetical protein OJ253_2271 [Cryptosporidium canis]